MKKLFLLLVVIPFFGAAQTNLVKWFRSDLQPTLLENHISSTSLTGVGNQEWGSDNVFYSTNGNFTSSFSPDFTRFIQFTLGPDAGYQIKPTTFSFNARSQANSPKFQVQFSKNENFSNPQILLNEASASTDYVVYNLNFPSNTKIEPGEKLYIRLYVYQANDNLHIQHNLSGSIAPSVSGIVSAFTAVKPIALDDKTGTLKNTPLNIDILTNDDYVSSGSLSKITATKPAHGEVVVNNVNGVTYTPNSNYVGFDSFYYTLTNSVGESNSAKVEIQVIDGVEQVLVRWNKSNFSATGYNPKVFGDILEVKNEFMKFTQYVEGSPNPSFEFTGLPTKNEFNGKLDPSKYLSMVVKLASPNDLAYLTSLKLKFRSGADTGNITIKYSKNRDFSGSVFTLLDDFAYTNSWLTKEVVFASPIVLSGNETLYFRIYAYNTWNPFFIEFIQDGEAGPAITGIATVIAEEPCSQTVIWNGAEWSGIPTINKKAELNGDYSTAANGSFEACTLTVNSGKLSITPEKSVTVTNEIKVAPNAVLEVQNNGNLLQQNDGAGTNVGNAVVLRDIRIRAKRTQYNYLGSPVAFESGQTMKTIYPGLTSVLAYNESTNLFSNSNGIVAAGKGLALKEPTLAGVPDVAATKVTATFKGVPNNGAINYILANSNTSTTTAYGYNLLANPYPSNIDLKKLYDLNKGVANIDPTFYFWDNAVNEDVNQTQQGSNYNGQAYAAFNAAAGKAGTGTYAAGYLNGNEIGTKTPTNIMSVGQGFLVRSRASNTVFKFNNSIRTNVGVESAFFGKVVEEEEDRFWLKMITPANLKTNIAVVYFDGGNNELGDEDSDARSSSDYIFSIVEDKKLSINGRAVFNKSDKLQLGSQHFIAGNYIIALDKVEGVFAKGQKIYLKDSQTGIVTNLSAGNYTFAANAGMSTGRFEIIYESEATLATDGAVKEEIKVYKESGDFVVKAFSQKITELQLFDMSGRLVYQSKPNATKVVVNSAQLGNGVYILKINQNGTLTGKKVIK